MKNRLYRDCLLAAFWLLIVSFAYSDWEVISPGYEYQKFTTPQSVNVFVMRMALDKPKSRVLDSCIAQGQFNKTGLPYGGREVVSSMVKRNDDSIIYWGQRRQIIAAINGDYWERKTYPNGEYTGRPLAGQVVSGWFARRFTEFTGGSGFFWTVSGVPHIGGDVRNGFTQECPQRIIFPDYSSSFLTGINLERGANDIMLYTPQWAASTLTDNTGVEVLVKVDRPNYPVSPDSPDNSCNGIVVDIRNKQGNTFIPFDHVVLSGSGDGAAILKSKCVVGRPLNFKTAIKDYGFPSNIRTPAHPPQDWTQAFSAIGCDREILIEGKITNLPKSDTVKRARTGIAYNPSHVFFVVVEESNQKGASGMNFGELAVFYRDALAATHGCSVDGGGSSVLWVHGKGIVNKPSDGAERATCNGMFMVEIQEKKVSVTFLAGATATVKEAVELRSGPGVNYSLVAKIQPAQSGKIIEHSLNGVLATGQFWWRVQFGEVSGWCPENLIQ